MRPVTASPTVPLISVLSLFVSEGSLDRTFVSTGSVVSRTTSRETVAAFPAASVATTSIAFAPGCNVTLVENAPVTESTATLFPFTVTVAALGAVPLTARVAWFVTPFPAGLVSWTTGGVESTTQVQVARPMFPAISATSITALCGPSARFVGGSYATVRRL